MQCLCAFICDAFIPHFLPACDCFDEECRSNEAGAHFHSYLAGAHSKYVDTSTMGHFTNYKLALAHMYLVTHSVAEKYDGKIIYLL